MENSIVAYVHAYVGMGRNAGGETTIHDMLRYLVEHGWTATAIVSQPSPGMQEYYVDGVHVVPQVDKRTILAWVPKASVVISHLDNAERTFFVAKKFRTPNILLAHSDHPIIGGYLALGPDLAVFNTDWVKEAHKYEGHSLVVHPAVDASRYTAERTKEDLVTMVNMWEYKGAKVFWEVARRMPETKFLAVRGGYGDQVIEDLDNVEVIDNTDDMAGVYARAGVVLMPSKYESYGRVAVEAASQGIPSIVADTPGLREAMGEATTFIRADSSDEVDQYIAALKKLKHWKSRAAAGKKAKARYTYLEGLAKDELEAFRVTAESLAETGRAMRGW